MCRVITAYPHLRESLAADFIEVSDEQLDAIVAEIYGPGVSAEDAEAFWSDVGRGFRNVARGASKFAQQAAPMVARALPAVAQGAMSGAALGPWGALAGAVAGGAGSILSQQRNPTLRGIGGAIGGATQLAGSFTGGGAMRNLAGVALGGGRGGVLGNLDGGALGGRQRRGPAGAMGSLAQAGIGALGGGAGGSANALLGLLSRPEALRALSSAALGSYGRPHVPVGNQAVSVQSILGALGNLAGRAAAEVEVASEQLPAYYYGGDGELAIDPADAEQRTEALLELFAETPSPYLTSAQESEDYESEDVEGYESDEGEYTDDDAVYDEWLLANEMEWSEDQEASRA